MTNKEAIEIAKESLKEAEQTLQTGPLMNYITEREDLHDEIKPILEKAKKRIEANRQLIEIAERFEGAMPIMWTSNAFPKNVKNFDLYAIPKDTK